jgi:hypothetical protein
MTLSAAPGSVVLARDAEWLVTKVSKHPTAISSSS